jgi:hypothetical protein
MGERDQLNGGRGFKSSQKHSFFYFLELMGERDQLNGPVRHDHQAAVPCLGRGTRTGRARPD